MTSTGWTVYAWVCAFFAVTNVVREKPLMALLHCACILIAIYGAKHAKMKEMKGKK